MATDLMEIDVAGELMSESDGHEVVARGGTMQQVKTGYTTAVAVQHPRDLQVVHKRLMTEARLAGEAFFYGWGNNKDKIEGPSVDLAMAAARCYHNSAVDVLPIQETTDAWIITAVFVDLETGFTLARQFRQSKKWTIYGKFDDERKDDIRFQIGQSKAVRNTILNALPRWLIDAAMKEAKNGVRARIEDFIAKKGIAAAIDTVIAGLQKHGVGESDILIKCQIAERKAMQIEHIVSLRGDLFALDNGQDYPSTLFPTLDGGKQESGSKVGTSSLNDKLKDSEPKQLPDNLALQLETCTTKANVAELVSMLSPGLSEDDARRLDDAAQTRKDALKK